MTLLLGTVLGVVISGLTLMAASDPPGWSIDGRVISSSKPVKEATVTAGGPESIRATTDAEGRYVLKGAVPGRYLISASKDGLGAPKPKSISVLPGGQVGSVDFEMNRPSVVAGRVVDASRSPVEGAFVIAVVKAYRDGRLMLVPKGRSTTNDLGEYRISGLGDGRHFVFVVPRALEPKKRPARSTQAKGAAPVRVAFYPNSGSIEGAAPLLLQKGNELVGIDIVAGTEESVCLTGSTRPPPEWSGIEAFVSLYTRIGDTFPTAANGPVKPGETFEVCGVTPGPYTFVATVWDPRGPRLAGLFRTEVLAGKHDIDLGAMSLAASSSLRGGLKVDGDTGQDSLPHPLHIELVRRGRPILVGENLRGEVLPSGEFAIVGVFDDDYGLRVDGLPRGYYVQEAVQQGRDVKLAPVRPGNGFLSISLRSDGGFIQGRTVDKDKNLVPDATVILVPRNASDGSQVWVQRSNQNGEFDFASGIAPGEYRVAAFDGLYEGEDRDPEFIRTNLPSATEVSVARKGSSQLTLRVRVVR